VDFLRVVPAVVTSRQWCPLAVTPDRTLAGPLGLR